MSCRQEGYDKGYEDAINGEPNKIDGGLIYDLISMIADDENQIEWENGYADGYRDGKK